MLPRLEFRFVTELFDASSTVAVSCARGFADANAWPSGKGRLKVASLGEGIDAEELSRILHALAGAGLAEEQQGANDELAWMLTETGRCG